jgi:hypothetical protein
MLINLLCSSFTAVAAAVAWKHCQAYTVVSNTANFLWENCWIWIASWSIHSFWTDEETASLGLLRRTQVVLDCPLLVSCFSCPLHSSAPPWQLLLAPVLQWSASTHMSCLLEGIRRQRRRRQQLLLLLLYKSESLLVLPSRSCSSKCMDDMGVFCFF